MIYTELFSEGYISSIGATLVWTAPSDGATYVVRDIVLFAYTTPASADIQDGSSPFLCGVVGLAAQTSAHFDMRQVIPNGETLILNLALGLVTYRITGYRLT